MGRITLNTLVSGAERRLEIFYMGCARGMGHEVHDPVVRHCRPAKAAPADSILIVDPAMQDLIMRKPARHVHDFFHHHRERGVCFIAMSDGRCPPEEWQHLFDRLNIPWCVSRHDPYLLESRLLGLIRERTAGTATMHAGLIEIDGWGILLTGEAGSGKTRTAVELIRQGHRLVADDVVILKKRAPGILAGRAHKRIKGLLHLRDKGIHAVMAYGKESCICEEAVINLIYELPYRENHGSDVQDGASVMKDIMGISIPMVRGRFAHAAAQSAKEIIEIVHQRQRGDACE